MRVIDSFNSLTNESFLSIMNWKTPPPLLVLLIQLISYIEIWQNNLTANQLGKFLSSIIPELYKNIDYYLCIQNFQPGDISIFYFSISILLL